MCPSPVQEKDQELLRAKSMAGTICVFWRGPERVSCNSNGSAVALACEAISARILMPSHGLKGKDVYCRSLTRPHVTDSLTGSTEMLTGQTFHRCPQPLRKARAAIHHLQHQCPSRQHGRGLPSSLLSSDWFPFSFYVLGILSSVDASKISSSTKYLSNTFACGSAGSGRPL